MNKSINASSIFLLSLCRFLRTQKRRGDPVIESPAALSLGGLIGRRKTSFSNQCIGEVSLPTSELWQSAQNSGISPVGTDDLSCLGKPVVFLEYGDL